MVRAMDTLPLRRSIPAPRAVRLQRLQRWRQRIAAGWRWMLRSEEEKFLAGATGLDDLERRLKALERRGGAAGALPPAASPWHW
jgi:hypothetical protein